MRAELERIDRHQLTIQSALLANSGLDPKKAKSQFSRLDSEFDAYRNEAVRKFSRDKLHADQAMGGRISLDSASATGESLRTDFWWETDEKKKQRQRRKKRKR